MSPFIYLPIEMGSRELLPKLLIASFAVERGLNVLIGSQHQIAVSAATLPAGIFYSKGTNDIFVRIAQDIRPFGHLFVASEEENFGYCLDKGPLSFNSANLAEVCDLYLCLSQSEADYMHNRYGSALPTSVTGNARADFLREECRKMFEGEIAEIKEKFGKFVLINGNFGTINSGQFDNIEQIFVAWNQLGVFDEETDTKKNATALNEFIDWENINANTLRELLAMLAQKNYTVIIRPHPSEKAETWVNIVNELDAANVHVLEGTSHISYMLAAELTVHTGCTTGAEALLLGAPVINLQIGDSPVHDYYVSNIVNLNYPDAKTAFNAIEKHFSGDRFISENRPALMKKAQYYFDGVDEKKLSAEKIVDAFEVLAKEKSLPTGSAADFKTVKWFESDALQSEYFRKKLGMEPDQVESAFSTLQKALGRFESLKIETISELVYTLKPST